MSGIRLMTDKECAKLLRVLLKSLMTPCRGDGKSMARLRYYEALIRAIQVLEGGNKNDIQSMEEVPETQTDN